MQEVRSLGSRGRGLPGGEAPTATSLLQGWLSCAQKPPPVVYADCAYVVDGAAARCAVGTAGAAKRAPTETSDGGCADHCVRWTPARAMWTVRYGNATLQLMRPRRLWPAPAVRRRHSPAATLGSRATETSPRRVARTWRSPCFGTPVGVSTAGGIGGGAGSIGAGRLVHWHRPPVAAEAGPDHYKRSMACVRAALRPAGGGGVAGAVLLCSRLRSLWRAHSRRCGAEA